MAKFTPAQHQAIHNLATNLIVAAGAGAGKTRVLVERYIHILSQREAECDEILAITFTNKAAKEMKERIRMQASMLAERSGAEVEQVFWREVKSCLEYAPIGTFHSFCARVLRENPVEAAMDPNFAVLDEFEADTVVAKVLKQVMETALREQTPWLERLLNAYEKSLLVESVTSLYEKIGSEGILTDSLGARLAEPYCRAIDRSGHLKDELRNLCLELIAFRVKLKPGSAHYRLVEQLENNWAEVAEAIETLNLVVMRHYLGGLKAQSKDKEIVASIREVCKSLELVRADRIALMLIPDLCNLLLAFKAALDKYKTEHRVLTFGDMEVRTVELLKNYPAVCNKYNTRIRRIMVDEFQDTNDLQRQIIYLLAGGDAERLLGNKLFVVGDAKQSIYRFRGADVAVFDRVRQDIVAAGGEALELDINFRSMDGLLAVFNECFAAVMGTEADQVRFCPLEGHRCTSGEDEPKAEFLVIPKSSLQEGQSARSAEAEAIAARIREMVNGDETLVDQDAKSRKVCYGDIAVLFRVASDINIYASALQQAGVPYYVIGGRGFFRCQEVLDVINLIRVVDNRYQEKALAGVLRSPMFLLADETLVLLKLYCGSMWQGLKNYEVIVGLSDEERRGAGRAWQVINRLRRLRGIVRNSELVRMALEDTGYLNFVLTQFMGEQKYANLIKLVSMATTLETKGLKSLGDFIRYLTKLVEDDVKEGEAQIESEGGDTVKLMTIHKSKGLEYPVVFIPDLHRKFNNDNAALMFGPGGLGLKVPDENGLLTVTSVYQGIAAEDKRLALLELKRVLYVAFTRAKDYLVLSAVGDKATGGKDYIELSTWLDWMGRVYEFDDLTEIPHMLGRDKAAILVRGRVSYQSDDTNLLSGVDNEVSAEDEILIRHLEYRIGPLSSDGNTHTFSPSDIIRFKRCQRSFYYKKVAELPEYYAASHLAEDDSPPGHLVGSVLHRSLELLRPGFGWRLCLDQAVEEMVSFKWRKKLQNKVAPLLNKYIKSDIAQQLEYLSTRKEWPFFFRLVNRKADGGYQFTGVVDCLVTYEDGTFGIIDYKTDNFPIEQTADKAREHSLQLVLYAVAVETALKQPVKDARVYFARHGVAVNVSLEDKVRQAALAEALAVCEHAERFTIETDFVCSLQGCEYCGFQHVCQRG
ncbi:MAG: addA [Firmicutes bacterium]|nr:addA [Bacillota bacterium]